MLVVCKSFGLLVFGFPFTYRTIEQPFNKQPLYSPFPNGERPDPPAVKVLETITATEGALICDVEWAPGLKVASPPVTVRLCSLRFILKVLQTVTQYCVHTYKPAHIPRGFLEGIGVCIGVPAKLSGAKLRRQRWAQPKKGGKLLPMVRSVAPIRFRVGGGGKVERSRKWV